MTVAGRRTLIIVAVAVAVLAGAEVTARLLSAKLPEPQRWQSIEAQQKVEQMDRLSRTGVDIVFVGTSLVNVAIEPSIVAQGIGPEVEVYNAALSAGVPAIMEPWTTSVVLPRLRPKVVVLGISTFDFYDHVSAEEFRKAFVNSAGGRQAMGRENLLDKASRRISGISEAWEYRTSLREPKPVARALRGNRPEPPVGEFGEVTADGRTGPKRVRATGAQARRTAPVRDWALGERNPAAIRRLVTEVQRTGATVIVVNMPVTDLYIRNHPNGDADYRAYLDAARGLTSEMGVPFVEVPFTASEDAFFDQLHLLADQGDAFTRLLTARLLEQPAVGKLRTGSR